ncbi:MAG: phosphoenolpyruvate carboxylase [Flavobacteriaceae bacterium]|nr:phosphoenolpyruvate carboxylase [Flavobacteriaceae bacterium]
MNQREDKLELFRNQITNKYLIYNSLFTNLPNENIKHTGIYIPLLQKLSHRYYQEKKSPEQVIQDFFKQHTRVENKDEEFDFLFRMVQYIERQVVLFDSVEDASFSDFNKAGIDAFFEKSIIDEETLNHFKNFGVRVVFTAHPTQFYPNSVQSIMHQLRESIKINQIEQVDKSLQQLAFTPFINHQKPTPFDEAKSIIFYLRYVYYQTLGRLYHKICNQLNVGPEFNPSLLQLGFWPGGDRDGNPFVNASITLEVANELRTTVMKCYYHHLKWLMRKVSFRKTQEPLNTLKKQLYNQIFQKKKTLTSTHILNTLEEVKALLISDYNSLFLDEINDFIGRIHLFGAHFASLDIRQDSSVHSDMITQLVQKEFKLDWQKLNLEEKIEVLTQRSILAEEAYYEDELFADTLRNVKQIRKIQEKNGKKSIHRYIISNTENIVDVLTVYGLFKFCGYEDNKINIDIVPLFETMEGMKNALYVMEELYKNPTYSAHLKRRNNEQHIMLGFSDGTKDGGYLKANWEIYNTKEVLTALSRKYGIKVIFFDGRGGPPARGGGKTHQFYASQGPEIENKNIQLTIQGQTITSVFGTHDQATYNFEQLLLSGVKSLQSKKFEPEMKDLMSDLAQMSYQKYLSLKNHPLFPSYLEEMTPLKQYGATNIGSRPTKRKNSSKLELKDLRAIPFVGSWSMIRQNIPGYYGVGTALEKYENDFGKVEALYQKSDFFKSLIHNSIMSMKKTYFPLTAYMAEHSTYGEFWKELRREYLLTKKWVLKLTHQEELMENEPRARMSISAREKIILPLLSIQQYALIQMQKNDSDYETYEKLVIRCLFGNINASRNSA